MRALISVSDKTGLDVLAKALVSQGYEIVSTGGTLRYLADCGLPVTAVSDVTQFPEIMNGRVKTLHPLIHGGILARRDVDTHRQACDTHGIGLIDVVVVNLYPFQATVSQPNVALADAIENIDIGGPSMVRSAAKNHEFVAVITNPDRYSDVIQALQTPQGLSAEFRRSLAIEAFEHTAQYDAAIAQYLGRVSGGSTPPNRLTLQYEKHSDLRYGENPHQKAAFYKPTPLSGLSGLIQHHGKALSYNNLVDAEAAWELARAFEPSQSAVVIIKHTNPCGVAVKSTLVDAYSAAYAADPVSAFGSIIGVNQPVDAATASAMQALFVEPIVAPGYTPEALAILTQKPSVRLLELPDFFSFSEPFTQKVIMGGVLYQESDSIIWDNAQLSTVTGHIAPEQWADLKLAFTVVKSVKSNAIVLAKHGVVIGVGAGQMSRVEAAKLALMRVQNNDNNQQTTGCVAASDAFFPFPDSITHLGQAGISVIVQPGGSKKDDAVIAECEKHGMGMVMTGIRHFKH